MKVPQLGSKKMKKDKTIEEGQYKVPLSSSERK